jgi:hypothetical protein
MSKITIKNTKIDGPIKLGDNYPIPHSPLYVNDIYRSDSFAVGGEIATNGELLTTTCNLPETIELSINNELFNDVNGYNKFDVTINRPRGSVTYDKFGIWNLTRLQHVYDPSTINYTGWNIVFGNNFDNTTTFGVKIIKVVGIFMVPDPTTGVLIQKHGTWTINVTSGLIVQCDFSSTDLLVDYNYDSSNSSSYLRQITSTEKSVAIKLACSTSNTNTTASRGFSTSQTTFIDGYSYEVYISFSDTSYLIHRDRNVNDFDDANTSSSQVFGDNASAIKPRSTDVSDNNTIINSVYGFVQKFHFNGSSWENDTILQSSPPSDSRFGDCIRITRDGTRVFVSDPEYGKIFVYSYSSNTLLYTIDTGVIHSNFILDFRISQDGSRIAMGVNDGKGKIRIYEESPANVWTLVHTIQHPMGTYSYNNFIRRGSFDISGDGLTIITGSSKLYQHIRISQTNWTVSELPYPKDLSNSDGTTTSGITIKNNKNNTFVCSRISTDSTTVASSTIHYSSSVSKYLYVEPEEELSTIITFTAGQYQIDGIPYGGKIDTTTPLLANLIVTNPGINTDQKFFSQKTLNLYNNMHNTTSGGKYSSLNMYIYGKYDLDLIDRIELTGQLFYYDYTTGPLYTPSSFTAHGPVSTITLYDPNKQDLNDDLERSEYVESVFTFEDFFDNTYDRTVWSWKFHNTSLSSTRLSNLLKHGNEYTLKIYYKTLEKGIVSIYKKQNNAWKVKETLVDTEHRFLYSNDSFGNSLGVSSDGSIVAIADSKNNKIYTHSSKLITPVFTHTYVSNPSSVQNVTTKNIPSIVFYKQVSPTLNTTYMMDSATTPLIYGLGSYGVVSDYPGQNYIQFSGTKKVVMNGFSNTAQYDLYSLENAPAKGIQLLSHVGEFGPGQRYGLMTIDDDIDGNQATWYYREHHTLNPTQQYASIVNPVTDALITEPGYYISEIGSGIYNGSVNISKAFWITFEGNIPLSVNNYHFLYMNAQIDQETLRSFPRKILKSHSAVEHFTTGYGNFTRIIFDFTEFTGSYPALFSLNYPEIYFKIDFDLPSFGELPLSYMQVEHGLPQAPEMIMTKCVNQNADWFIWHKDMLPNKISSSVYSRTFSGDLPMAPDNLVINLIEDPDCSYINREYIDIAITSSDYIKVGSYIGDGSGTTVFNAVEQTRMMMIKNITADTRWIMLTKNPSYSSSIIYNDLGSTNRYLDPYITFDDITDEITISSGNSMINGYGSKYIFVAFSGKTS